MCSVRHQYLYPLFAPSGGVLHLTATTTGAQTVTIQRLTPTGGNVVINWGDGSVQTIADGYAGTITHNYAGAGTWPITVSRPRIITHLDLRDSKLGGLNTAELRNSVLVYFLVTAITESTIRSADMVNWRPTNWQLYSMPAGTYVINSADMVDWRPQIWYLYSMPAGTYVINSADMVNWRPAVWYLYSMPAGTYVINSADMVDWRPQHWRLYSIPTGTYVINSADMVNWRPTYWYLYSIPAGTYVINSADMVDWRPTIWRLSSMPAGTYVINSADIVNWRPAIWRLYSMPAGTYTFAASCMRNWASVQEIQLQDLGLSQAVVDTIVNDIWNGKPTYTYATPSLNIGGTNADPSGVYQANCPPTSGLEQVYDLVNGNCTPSGPEWSVTY